MREVQGPFDDAFSLGSGYTLSSPTHPLLIVILVPLPSLSRFLGWEFLTFSLGKIFELLFGHGLGHLFRRAFEAGFARFAALGCQCCPRGHLLFFRFRRHTF